MKKLTLRLLTLFLFVAGLALWAADIWGLPSRSPSGPKKICRENHDRFALGEKVSVTMDMGRGGRAALPPAVVGLPREVGRVVPPRQTRPLTPRPIPALEAVAARLPRMPAAVVVVAEAADAAVVAADAAVVGEAVAVVAPGGGGGAP